MTTVDHRPAIQARVISPTAPRPRPVAVRAVRLRHSPARLAALLVGSAILLLAASALGLWVAL